MKKVSRGTIIGMPWWYKTWQHSGYNHTRAKQKLLRKRKRVCKSSWTNQETKNHDYFRVTGAHDTVLDYADLFSITLRNDKVQEFDTRWDEILLSMTKIPSDDLQESLYKLRILESAQLKTVLELYDMEIHQKLSIPN